jgi:hypothetical protein
LFGLNENFLMSFDVFQSYKPLRNRIALLSVEEALAVIWAYCHYLQTNDFQFPKEIEVDRGYLALEIPQKWISEWVLELIAKEVILNAGVVASKGRSLRKWKTLSEIVNALKSLENEIYGAYGSPKDILVEFLRIAHRQFIWQGNPPNSISTMRYYKIFNRTEIDKICEEKIGLNVWEIYMCGIGCMGLLLSHPAIAIPFKTEIKALTIEKFEKFFTFTSKPIAALKAQLKPEQQYNADFAYAYSSLRAFPLIRMTYQGSEALVCPLMTLLYWRFTGGLYYELIGVPEFANAFGDGFQDYVGEVIERACSDPFKRLGEVEYTVGKAKKRSVDWIVADETAALFVECKSKRLSLGAKVSLSDPKPLEGDIDSMAAAVVQLYKTISDYRENAYPHFPAEGDRRIFPAIVTLENWRMFGPVMLNKLTEAVARRLASEGLAPELVEQMPYSVWAIEELEVGLQIMRANGIAGVIEGKLNDPQKREWDWHGYMTNQYPKSFPAKRLFDDQYDEMFAALHAAQKIGDAGCKER